MFGAHLARRLILLAGVTMACVRTPTVAEDPQRRWPLDAYRLGNGMRVVLAPDDALPFVATTLGIDVGGNREGPTTWGLAHFVEHLAFQGSVHIPKAVHDTGLADVGGTGDAMTSYDFTVFYALAPAHQLETLLWLDSDRLGFLSASLDDARVANQKQVIHAERSQTRESPAYARADLAVVTSLFAAPHPYHGAVIGTHDDIDRVTTEGVRAFIDRYYVPRNAVLVVAGRFEPAAAMALIERYYGTLPGGERAAVAPGGEVGGAPASVELVDDVERVRVSLAWRVAPAYSRDLAALEVVRQMIGGGASGDLIEAIVHRQALAERASCTIEALQLGSVFRCDAYLREGVEVAAAASALRSYFADLSDGRLDERRVARGQALREAELLGRTEDLQSRANEIAVAALLTGDPRRGFDEVAAALAVTPAEVRRVVRTYLVDVPPLVVVVRPRS